MSKAARQFEEKKYKKSTFKDLETKTWLFKLVLVTCTKIDVIPMQ